MNTCDALLIVAGLALLAAAAVAFVVVRPRRQLILPYLVSLGACVVIYLAPPGMDGRSGFHERILLCGVAALAVGSVTAARSLTIGDGLARFAVSVFAVATPPLVLFGVLSVACWGQPSCLN